MNDKINDIVIAYCDSCKNDSNHRIVANHEKRYSIGDSPRCGIDFAEGTFQTLECLGCEDVHFRMYWFTSEDWPDEVVKFTRYPEKQDNFKNKMQPKRFSNLPRHLRLIYEETIQAYNHKSTVLAAAGIRALVEAVCVDRGVTDGLVKRKKNDGTEETTRKNNLEGKIEGMKEKAVITVSHAAAFHQCRFLGNEAVHELERPYPEELKLALEIIENTLESVFEVPEKISEVDHLKNHRLTKKLPNKVLHPTDHSGAATPPRCSGADGAARNSSIPRAPFWMI